MTRRGRDPAARRRAAWRVLAALQLGALALVVAGMLAILLAGLLGGDFGSR